MHYIDKILEAWYNLSRRRDLRSQYLHFYTTGGVMRRARVMLLAAATLALYPGASTDINASSSVKIAVTCNGGCMASYSKRAKVHVQVWVEKSPDNSVLCVQWLSEDGEEGLEEAPLNGERTSIRPYDKDIAVMSGTYIFIATLYRSNGTTVEAKQEIIIR